MRGETGGGGSNNTAETARTHTFSHTHALIRSDTREKGDEAEPPLPKSLSTTERLEDTFTQCSSYTSCTIQHWNLDSPQFTQPGPQRSAVLLQYQTPVGHQLPMVEFKQKKSTVTSVRVTPSKGMIWCGISGVVGV